MRSGVDETLCGTGERLIKRRAQSRAPGVFYRVGRNRFGRVRLGKRDAETRADRSRGRRKIESGALSATGKRFSARRGLCAARGRSGEAFGRWFDRARPCALWEGVGIKKGPVLSNEPGGVWPCQREPCADHA